MPMQARLNQGTPDPCYQTFDALCVDLARSASNRRWWEPPIFGNCWERGAAATAAGGGLALPWGLGRLAPAGEPSPDGGPEAGGTSIDPPSRPSCCLALVSSLALWGPVLPPMGAC